MLASLVASATSNFNADNDGNAGVPSAATGLSISSFQYPDSTSALTEELAFAPDASCLAVRLRAIRALLLYERNLCIEAMVDLEVA